MTCPNRHRLKITSLSCYRQKNMKSKLYLLPNPIFLGLVLRVLQSQVLDSDFPDTWVTGAQGTAAGCVIPWWRWFNPLSCTGCGGQGLVLLLQVCVRVSVCARVRVCACIYTQLFSRWMPVKSRATKEKEEHTVLSYRMWFVFESHLASICFCNNFEQLAKEMSKTCLNVTHIPNICPVI